ncbi:hypothetical protein [Streptomyces longisporoflavus]|uniref:Glycine zipper family protein n=1 Tax=Streptomyces longisporoflavus TaxID=28044 RepID=A0ABW7R3Y1_9ACTN
MKAIDYLIRDGRAIETSNAHPTKSRLVRPMLEIDLPFITDVNLQDFSKITIAEFDSYSGFRVFLREKLLSLDDAVNAEQSDVALTLAGQEIEQEILAIKAQMEVAQRTRAFAATGASVGTVSAVLVAVWAPALEQVLTILGASGGIWGALSSIAADTKTRELKNNRWHYVWALQSASRHN